MLDKTDYKCLMDLYLDHFSSRFIFVFYLFDLTNVGNYVDGTTFHAYDVDLEILIKD